ncbi:MAG: hypothetical protein QM734_15360 [Cyclobacteriaceae bacterium]
MAKNQTRRISPKIIADDIYSNDALKKINGYSPANSQYGAANIQTSYTTMITAQTNETQAIAALATARDLAAAAEWAFHNALLGAKDQVKAQFGKDSNEVQSLGLKKTSEYRNPKSKSTTK